MDINTIHSTNTSNKKNQASLPKRNVGSKMHINLVFCYEGQRDGDGWGENAILHLASDLESSFFDHYEH